MLCASQQQQQQLERKRKRKKNGERSKEKTFPFPHCWPTTGDRLKPGHNRPPFFFSLSLCPTITHYSSRNARPRTKRTLIHAAASPFMTITDKLPPPPFLSFFVCIRRVASFRRSHPQWIHFQVFI